MKHASQITKYDLVVAKGGPKLKLSENQSLPKTPAPGKQLPLPPPAKAGEPAPPPPGNLYVTGGRLGLTLLASAVGWGTIVNALSTQLRTDLIDKTGLQNDLYDVKLQWMPDPTEDGSMRPATPGGALPPAPNIATSSIFTAVQEQLGLRLVSAKGPVDVLVIDRVQKPTMN